MILQLHGWKPRLWGMIAVWTTLTGLENGRWRDYHKKGERHHLRLRLKYVDCPLEISLSMKEREIQIITSDTKRLPNDFLSLNQLRIVQRLSLTSIESFRNSGYENSSRLSERRCRLTCIDQWTCKVNVVQVVPKVTVYQNNTKTN